MSPETIPLMRSDAPKILTKLVMVLAGMPGQQSRSICVDLDAGFGTLCFRYFIGRPDTLS